MPKIRNKKTRSKKTKKRLDDFLLSEEGKIKKKDLAKLGVSLATLATMFQDSTDVEAQTGHNNVGTHYNVTPHYSGFAYGSPVPADGHFSGSAWHASGVSHGSHASHASHGQW